MRVMFEATVCYVHTEICKRVQPEIKSVNGEIIIAGYHCEYLPGQKYIYVIGLIYTNANTFDNNQIIPSPTAQK